MGADDDEEFLSELASAAFGAEVGSVSMPLHGMGAAGEVVYGSSEQGFLHLNQEAIRRFRDQGRGEDR